MKLSLRTLALGSFLTALGAAGLFAYPALADDSGGSLWEFVELRDRMAEADRNIRRIDREDEVLLRRLAIKQEVIHDLVAGKLSFQEAAARFTEVNRMEETCAAFMRKVYRGRTDEDRAAWQLVAQLRRSPDSATRALGEEWECVLTARESAITDASEGCEGSPAPAQFPGPSGSTGHSDR